MIITSKKANQQYDEISARGNVKKQNVDQHELVRLIMREGFKEKGKIWWFAYELMGHWELKGERYYFMSYKASTRVCELAKDGEVETRPTEGKLCVYALRQVLEHLENTNQ